MDYATTVTLLIIVAAMVCFAIERFSVDHVAISAMVLLVLCGILSPQQAVRGFANPATLTVAAMFVLSDALIKTGIIRSLAPIMRRIFRRGQAAATAGMMTIAGAISAFINNTPVVATLIPLVSDAARQTENPPSRFLMALSFGAIFGGSCTLIGTSTNLLVSGIAERNGETAFSMFQLAPMGLVLALTGSLYMLLAAPRLLPRRDRDKDLRQTAGIRNFLTEIRAVDLPGEDLTINALCEREGARFVVESLKRNSHIDDDPSGESVLQTGDVLLVRGDMEQIQILLRNKAFHLAEEFAEKEFPEKETHLIEIVVLSNSELAEKRLSEVDFLEKFNANVLAIHHREHRRVQHLREIRLWPGDVLLLEVNEQGYDLLRHAEDGGNAPFLSLHRTQFKEPRLRELLLVGATLVGVVGSAAAGWVDIMTAAIAGSALLVASGVIQMRDAYRAIDWQVIFLLAGALSLGAAMEESGMTDMIGDFLVADIGSQWGPVAVVSALYLVTALCTAIMSNNAAAALLAPIALTVATSQGLRAEPFLMAVAFGASASFVTPIGYQTNTMIFSAGDYRFSDFIKVGGPLNLIFWIVGSLLIPVFYPLTP